MKNKSFSKFRAAWKAGCPLISIETVDPAASVRNCIYSLNGKADATPLLEWDLIQGLRGTSIPGQKFDLGFAAAQAIAEGTPGPDAITNPAELLALLAKKAPADCIVFLHGMHRLVSDAPVSQGLWNMRDIGKAKHITLVLLSPGITLPAELAQDFILLNEPLPNRDELSAIIDSTFGDAELNAAKLLTPDNRERAIDALRGLGAFSAEQVTATSLVPTGIDFDSLWDKKVAMIEATPGLTVYRGKEKLADVAGLSNAKAEGVDTIKGKLGITCIVLIDEMDKGFAAASTDTSGTTQDQNKALLSHLQDKRQTGMLWLGPPGTGKTLLAKALANEFGIPLIMLDLGAMKGSLVGQSEQQMRAALRIISAISDDKALWIGACNRSENLPPELRRRFNYCSMFFDLPDAEERKAAWNVHRNAYGLTPEQCDTVNDQGWTGAEIHNACLKAWAKGCSLSKAALNIVPVSISAADIVDGLRKASSGKYVSASAPGLYRYNQAAAPVATGRKIEV